MFVRSVTNSPPASAGLLSGPDARERLCPDVGHPDREQTLIAAWARAEYCFSRGWVQAYLSSRRSSRAAGSSSD